MNANFLFTIYILYNLGAIFTGTFIMIASYAECDQNMAIIWFSIAIGFMGVYYSHVKINALDLGPNYAGVLMALSNGMGAVTASVSPLFASYMTPNVSGKNVQHFKQLI